MPEPHDLQGPAEALGALERHLAYLKLGFIAEQYTAAGHPGGPTRLVTRRLPRHPRRRRGARAP